VGNLASTDPARLHRPLPLTELQHDVLPYRANRRALELDTSEDYEMVLLRLCAGEGGLVRTEPEEARVRFAKELKTPNPDLAVLHAFENVVLTLRTDPLARALGPDRDRDAAYAPPAAAVPDPEPEVVGASGLPLIPGLDELPDLDEATEPEAPAEPRAEVEPPYCLYCGGVLPGHRVVNYCPHCGQSQTVPTCPNCRGELEPGWKHCVNCGTAVGQG
jgi:predicted RNA-binding Zn-ribbon protein involved in translation (DUF1610 family)